MVYSSGNGFAKAGARMRRKGRTGILLLLLISVGIPVILAAGLYLFLFRVNQFHLDLAHTLLYGTCSDCAAGSSGTDRTGGLAHE